MGYLHWMNVMFTSASATGIAFASVSALISGGLLLLLRLART